MSEQSSIGATGAVAAAAKRYGRDMGVASLAYTAVLVACVYTVRHFDPPQWVTVPLALAPVAPVLLMLRAYLTFLGKLDEFQRRVQLEAMLAAAGIVGFASFTYGFLESFAGFPTIEGALIWVLPAMIGTWGIAQILVRRRYQ